MPDYPPEVARDTFDDHVVIWHCEPPVMYGHYIVPEERDTWEWDTETGIPERHITSWSTPASDQGLADAG